MTAHRRLGQLIGGFSLALVGLPACSTGSVLRGQIDGLNGVVRKAEENGAIRCAPRELALAKAHLRFAAVELDQGASSTADEHVRLAGPNAEAALAASDPDECVENRAPKVGDKDGDGIPDDSDKCPDQREAYNGLEDEDGCPDDPDTDGDKVVDARDQCILEPEDLDGYLDDDGCPELDNDLDGLADSAEECDDKPEDHDGFQDEDGCPEPDNDGDTVADIADQCPISPGPDGGERPGCPKKHTFVVVTAKEIRINQQIQFQFNKAAINPVSYPILDEVVTVLRDLPQIRIEVQGHTDNAGNAKYNKKLSQQRADSVRAYLVAKGIAPDRLVARGYGMDQPLVKNDTAANKALNRRVQFIRVEGGSANP